MDDNGARETLLDLNSIGHRPGEGTRTPDLENAFHQFLDDLEARNLARATLRTYSATLGSFSNFVTGEGLQTVIEVTPDVLSSTLYKVELRKVPRQHQQDHVGIAFRMGEDQAFGIAVGDLPIVDVAAVAKKSQTGWGQFGIHYHDRIATLL